jgi:hypothetical protein
VANIDATAVFLPVGSFSPCWPHPPQVVFVLWQFLAVPTPLSNPFSAVASVEERHAAPN